MNIFTKLVKPTNKELTIIVEMSGNHQNSFNSGLKFVNECIKQKADIVKFQVYTADTMTIKSNKKDFLVKKNKLWKKHKSLHDLFNFAHTPWDWVREYSKILRKNKIVWFASAFDQTSIEFLESIDCKR